MIGFRALLIVLWIVLVSYTAIVIGNHGVGLLKIFWGDIVLMGWPGQFNLDFTFMLALSAAWVSWRHRFSVVGLLLAGLAFVGGSLFLTTYLLILSWQAKGDMKEILLGKIRFSLL